MNYPNRKNELIIGLIALFICLMALALSMFFTWWSDKQNKPISKIKTTITVCDLSDTTSNALIREEGPGYIRYQFISRTGVTNYIGSSFYVEVQE